MCGIYKRWQRQSVELGAGNNAPSDRHWEMIKLTVRYVLQTQNYGICYVPAISGQYHGIEMYTDADLAGDGQDRKYTTGPLVTYHDQPIGWSSFKQSIV